MSQHIIKLIDEERRTLDDVDLRDIKVSIKEAIAMIVERNNIETGDRIVVEAAPL